jgi:hypothetical protein
MSKSDEKITKRKTVKLSKRKLSKKEINKELLLMEKIWGLKSSQKASIELKLNSKVN